jgi:magnesium and cobalt transporter
MNENKLVGSSHSRSLLEKISDLLSVDPKNKNDLLAVIRGAEDNGIIDHDASNVTQGALQMGDMQVREVMIPRSQMACLRMTQPMKEMLNVMIESGHSRFPVYGQNPDEIIGIVLAKDILAALIKNGSLEKVQIKECLRPASFVPESKRLNVLLREFRHNRHHMAIVIDEYGQVAGVVTIEDVLEQIVGEIDDEHDYDVEYMIRETEQKNKFIVKAMTPIKDFNHFFKSQLSDETFDTIGGLVLSHFGYLPKRDETIAISQFRFRILSSDTRQITLLQLEIQESTAEI